MDTGTTTQSDQLATAIRRRIVSGEFAPGNRLPTFQEIESDFSVSRGVAQIAIERLKRDGFVASASRQGLFVVPNPPHLGRYGIVFPVTHADSDWSRFDEVLVREARAMQQSGNMREFEVFAGIEDYRDGPDLIRRLRREVANDRLAGLILTPGSFHIAQQKPFSDPSFPKVYVFHHWHQAVGPIISGDGDSIIDRSLKYLADAGCTRVAVLRIEGTHSGLGKDHFARAGLVLHPQWIQVIGRGETTVLATLMPLLMDYPEDERPDGLCILDDNLTDHATSALVSMGLHIGQDIQVVTHCNWPVRAPSVLPVQRIGLHVGEILARCVETIDLQRQGQEVPLVQRVQAVFEDEMDPEALNGPYARTDGPARPGHFSDL